MHFKPGQAKHFIRFMALALCVGLLSLVWGYLNYVVEHQVATIEWSPDNQHAIVQTARSYPVIGHPKEEEDYEYDPAHKLPDSEIAFHSRSRLWLTDAQLRPQKLLLSSSSKTCFSQDGHYLYYSVFDNSRSENHEPPTWRIMRCDLRNHLELSTFIESAPHPEKMIGGYDDKFFMTVYEGQANDFHKNICMCKKNQVSPVFNKPLPGVVWLDRILPGDRATRSMVFSTAVMSGGNQVKTLEFRLPMNTERLDNEKVRFVETTRNQDKQTLETQTEDRAIQVWNYQANANDIPGKYSIHFSSGKKITGLPSTPILGRKMVTWIDPQSGALLQAGPDGNPVTLMKQLPEPGATLTQGNESLSLIVLQGKKKLFLYNAASKTMTTQAMSKYW